MYMTRPQCDTPLVEIAPEFQMTNRIYSNLNISHIFESKASFTLGVRANVEPKSSIPIGAKVGNWPKGFTLWVKAEIEKNIFNLRQANNKCGTFYGLVLAPRLKKGYHLIWETNLQPLGPMF